MASVQYIVYYKYVHPTIKKPVTNLTTDLYDMDNRYIQAYTPADALTASQDILDQQSADNAKYDMLFIYDGIMAINTILGTKLPTGTTAAPMPTIYIEKFERCKGEAWFVASYHASLQSALTAADPLVRALSKDNVRVMKSVALAITVGLE